MEKNTGLGDPSFVILTLLAEQPCHGYMIEKKIQDRGFCFWEGLGRSSIYSVLKSLQKSDLVTSRLEEGGGGPARRVFEITDEGRRQVREDGQRRLSQPRPARYDLDLGVYSIPLLGDGAIEGIETLLGSLDEREGELKERVAFCRRRDLMLPALKYERALFSLRAERSWLKQLRKSMGEGVELTLEQWSEYEKLGPDPAGR